MKSLSLFDLHCDTIYELFKNSAESLASNSCKIALDKVTHYDSYVQFFAAWCSTDFTDDQGFDSVCRMADLLDEQLARPENSGRMSRVTNARELDATLSAGRHAAILAVEDARILGADISRLDTLAARGIRYLTLCWGGNSCIGGAHNTDQGLTAFGKQVVCRCFALGIVPDISHTNAQSAQDAIDLAISSRKPLLATHSNAYSVYPHSRNLRDEHFLAVRDLGGLVGLNFCRPHLWNSEKEPITVSHIIRHLEHFLSLGGENTVAIGADWDGAPLPDGIDTIADAQKLAEEMARLGYTETLIRKIFFDNALAFFRRAFP